MLKEMTEEEFAANLVEKCAVLELQVKCLQEKLVRRALKVANRISLDFLDYEESDDGDKNYELLMKALSEQKQAYIKLKDT